MSAEPTYDPPAHSPIAVLRSYLCCTLYVQPQPNSAIPTDEHKLSLILESVTKGAGWEDEDIYASRMPGADIRAALRHADGSDYTPPLLGYANPVSGRIEPTIGIGYSDGDATASAAGAASINRTVLAMTPRLVTRTEALPATLVRRLVEVELAAINPALSQACVDIGMGLSNGVLSRRRHYDERQVRRINRRALDTLLVLCRRAIADREGSRKVHRPSNITETCPV